MKKTCSGPVCIKPIVAKGLCRGHYTQKARAQQLIPLRRERTDGKKWCNKCQQLLPMTQEFFFVDKLKLDQYLAYCRKCRVKLEKSYRFGKRKRWGEAKYDRAITYSAHYLRQIRYEALKEYGGRCMCCDETRTEFLVFDHINNGGNKHRREIRKTAAGIAQWLRINGYPKRGFRLLCHNCNSARGFYGYCPHERERDGETCRPFSKNPIKTDI